MASAAQDHYANRKSNNVYDSLAELVTSSGGGFLANNEYNKTFFKKTTWRGLDFQRKDGSEFRVNVFGEIQPESLGTKLSALGDFYIGTKEKPTYITVESNVKDRFALGAPSICSETLSLLFQDQLVALNEIVSSEQELEAADNKTYYTKEWLSASAPGGAGDIMTIVSPGKYKSPGSGDSRSPTIRRILTRSRPSPSTGGSGSSSAHAVPIDSEAIVEDTEYKAGQLYEPTRLYDYGGKLFRNQGCKLVQHEILNMDHQIIPPWDQYEALRMGTLVMATVTLHCFHMKIKDSQGNETGKERKIYQINFHRLLVIDDSIAEVEKRTIHPGYGLDGEDVAKRSSEDSSADRAMTSFQVKKIKLNSGKPAPSKAAKASADSTVRSSGPNLSSACASSSQPAVSKNKQSSKSAGKQKATAAGKATEKASSSAETLAEGDIVMEE